MMNGFIQIFRLDDESLLGDRFYHVVTVAF